MPELIIAAQLFNRENDHYAIDVEYKAYPASEINNATKPPSLIIGRYMLSNPVMKKFTSLDELFTKYYLDPNDMYPALLNAGKLGSRHVLLPVSFDCDLIIENKSETARAGTAMLDSETIRQASQAFTRIEDGKITSLGFSPRWDLSFAENWLLAGNVGFALNQNWKPTSVPALSADISLWPILWNKQNLEKSVEGLLSFNSDIRVSEQDAFAFVYFNKPGYQLVLEGKVLYWPMKASEFFKLPRSTREQLRYRFPTVEHKLILTSDSRYMGIPKGSKNRKAALKFARWLLVSSNQEKIWKEMESQQLLPDYVGAFDGFSSIMQVNETILLRYFPEYGQNPLLSAAIPEPAKIPDYWEDFSRDFLHHWLESAMSNPESRGAIDQDFRIALEKYVGTMPDWLISNH
jgi:ABC-type glycerol-3-phosphate transport system substrate-binding protein